jgi:two-component system sensor histidine kinase MprB
VTLRRRLGWAAAAAVGIAVVLAAVVCYFVVRGQLRGQIDDQLRNQASLVLQRGAYGLGSGGMQSFGSPGPNAGGRAPYAQVVSSAGPVPFGGVRLPLDAATTAVLSGGRNNVFEDVSVQGTDLRMLTFRDVGTDATGQEVPVAIQLARPLGPVDSVLSNLRLVLLLVCGLGIALAAVLGRLAASRVLRPLAEVTATAQLIGETDDLSRRIDVGTDDEVGQLASRFNAMLERLGRSRDELDASVQAQRQLVADASHELRTPVTSLRTNIEVLLDSDQLDPEDRRLLLQDVVEQSDELTSLVNDLIEVARGDLPADETEDVRLDHVVEDAVARARRNTPHVQVEAKLEPVAVEGVAERLHRVINNLLDNAARHSPEGGVIEVDVDGEGIRVRDHGGGIDEQDLPYVFERFYRGANSRGRQGSGLGLAIVRQVAAQHGGSVSAANAPDGGAVFTVRLPTHPAGDDEPPSSDAAPARVSSPLF